MAKKLKKGKAISGTRLMNYYANSQSPVSDELDQRFRDRYGDDVFYGTLFTQALNQESANKQMQFQDYMSSTAHQREVQDLQKAGLNPVLAANGGAAAASGAMGTADSSALTAKNQQKMNNAQIAATKQMASKERALQERIAANQLAGSMYMNKYSVDRSYELGMNQSALGYQASVTGARLSAEAQKFAASANAAAMKYAANQSAAAQRYMADQQRGASEFNSRSQYATASQQRAWEKEKQQAQYYYDKEMAKYNYTHQTGLFGSAANLLNPIFYPYFDVMNSAYNQY